MSTPQVAFRLDPDLIARLDRIAAARYCARSEVLRRLVEQGVPQLEQRLQLSDKALTTCRHAERMGS